MRVGRIVIRADDCYDSTHLSVAMTGSQAQRITKFVDRVSSRVHALFISCRFGEGRSAGAAVAISAALRLPWKEFTVGRFAPNGHIIALLTEAFRHAGYAMPSDLAMCDKVYASLRGSD